MRMLTVAKLQNFLEIASEIMLVFVQFDSKKQQFGGFTTPNANNHTLHDLERVQHLVLGLWMVVYRVLGNDTYLPPLDQNSPLHFLRHSHHSHFWHSHASQIFDPIFMTIIMQVWCPGISRYLNLRLFHSMLLRSRLLNSRLG